MRKRIRIVLFMALLLMVAVFAPTTVVIAQEVTLTLWAFEGFQDFLPVLIEAFEAEYPNIQVELTNIPEDQYGVRIETALAAGAPPDLGFIANRRWLKEGVFLPLDDMIAEQGIDLSTWNQGIIGDPNLENAEAACRYEDKLYCLGSYTGSVMLFYNKDMFDAAGLEYPTTWPPISNDRYVELACALTDEANGVWGTANGDPITLFPWEMVWSADGRTVEGVVNGPVSVRLHEQIAEMFQSGCAPSLNVMDPWQQGVDFFSQGKLAMVVTDFQSLFKIENNNINYGIAHVPAPEGLEPFFNVWTDGIGVFVEAAHPEEALLFVAFQGTEGQRVRVEVTGDVPVSSAVAEALNWAGDIPGRLEALAVLEHARPAAFVPNRWEVAGPVFDAFGYIVSAEKTAQEALDEAAPLMQEILDREWADWER